MHVHSTLVPLVFALVLLVGGIVFADGIVTGSPFGVAFGEGSKNLDHFMTYIHDLGLTRTKVSFYWNDLEPQPGVYDFSVLDQYLTQLGPEDQGLLNIFTSGWCTQQQGPCKGSPLVDCPYNDSGCATSCAEHYRAFIIAVAEHVKESGNGGIVYWQRDTEPASRFPHYPASAPKEYVEMQKIFYEAVKSVFPDAIVIGGNHNGSLTANGEPTNASFFDYFLKNARDYFDVLDVRLYEDIYTIPARVKWFRDRMHMYGYDKPIVSTEQGGPDPRTISKNGRSLFKEFLARVSSACPKRHAKRCFTRFLQEHRDQINPKLWPFYFLDDPEQADIYWRMQAADIIERNVVMLAAGVKATWWWNLRSAGTDPIFGKMRLMTDHYEKLPGYDVFKRMVSALGAVSTVTRIEVGDPSVYLYRVDRADADSPVYVAWRREGNADPYAAILTPAIKVDLPIPASAARVTDARGDAVTAAATDTGLELDLGGMPVYIQTSD